ncbi:MAG TPA: hypothetical protein VFL60_02665 [Gaiellaceae bacterium]|nr:hypothetical protein [Gaiellaceae bacterium]
MARRLAAAVLLVLALAGCGGSSTNGEAKKPAAQVVADAQKAAGSARIVHVVGTGIDNGRPLKLDLWLENGRGKGHLEESGAGFDVVRVGDAMYVKGSSAFLKRFAGGAAAALLHDRWLKSSATKGPLAALAPLTDKRQFVRAALGQHGKLENKGLVDRGGTKVVQIADTTQGGSLFVAAEGTPYPVALAGGRAQGSVTFSGWDAGEQIAAPKSALDLSKLTGR